ncbi:relaxin-3 receptor 1-like [Nerophis lumbriciformis]|uniref:relaxin-3 receptor 1-like n=1 Tax=Nerophis lumbriciformis TaxID=546530 RepID=UPI002AE0742B|nr:relaxin-3 receptor 1-like [Nerophis lumbriciformis]
MADDNQSLGSNRTASDLFRQLEDVDVSADGSPLLRVLICCVYSVVCAAGLLGNLLVFFLLGARQERRTSRLDFFVLNLALTDFQFVLTLPFWAVDTARDFSWPFGDAMCKAVLSVTVMNMYASVFFLTAMSVIRYLALASALPHTCARTSYFSDRCACAVIWTLATVATLPTAVFSTVSHVSGENLCLLKFPGGQDWLAVYHLHKILVGFVVPVCVVSVSYVMLLRLIHTRSMKTSNPRRRSRVTKSVTIVVLSFFLCWMPNHAITLWSVLVKLNAANWDRTYYVVHTYVFPLTVCLAHANSCLNPVIYCLMRPEFRTRLKRLLHRGHANS